MRPSPWLARLFAALLAALALWPTVARAAEGCDARRADEGAPAFAALMAPLE